MNKYIEEIAEYMGSSHEDIEKMSNEELYSIMHSYDLDSTIYFEPFKEDYVTFKYDVELGDTLTEEDQVSYDFLKKIYS